MMEEVREYIDIVFDQYEMTDEIKALRDEIVMDAEEHYRDCLAKGMSEKEAAQTVKQSLGDLGAMLREIGAEKIDRIDDAAESFYNASRTLRNALGRLFSSKPTKTIREVFHDVDSLDISGVAMDIRFEQSEDDTVYLSIEEDGETVEVTTDEHTLVIKENKNTHFSSPTVSLKVPALKDIRISVVSGDIETEGIKAENCMIKTTSGDIRLEETTIEACELHSISGDVQIEDGKYTKMEVVSKCGDVDISTEEVSFCKVSTISGDMELHVGWFAQMDLSAVSGDIRVEIQDDEDLQVDAGTVSGDCEIYGISMKKDGTRLLSAGTVSGDLEISKA